MKTRNQVLAEFPLISMDGSRHTGQLVQLQKWHPSVKDPRWINDNTIVQLDGEKLTQSGDGKWRNPETGEEFTTA